MLIKSHELALRVYRMVRVSLASSLWRRNSLIPVLGPILSRNLSSVDASIRRSENIACKNIRPFSTSSSRSTTGERASSPAGDAPDLIIEHLNDGN